MSTKNTNGDESHPDIRTNDDSDIEKNINAPIEDHTILVPEIIIDGQSDPQIMTNMQSGPQIMPNMQPGPQIMPNMQPGPQIMTNMQPGPQIMPNMQPGPIIMPNMQPGYAVHSQMSPIMASNQGYLPPNVYMQQQQTLMQGVPQVIPQGNQNLGALMMQRGETKVIPTGKPVMNQINPFSRLAFVYKMFLLEYNQPPGFKRERWIGLPHCKLTDCLLDVFFYIMEYIGYFFCFLVCCCCQVAKEEQNTVYVYEITDARGNKRIEERSSCAVTLFCFILLLGILGAIGAFLASNLWLLETLTIIMGIITIYHFIGILIWQINRSRYPPEHFYEQMIYAEDFLKRNNKLNQHIKITHETRNLALMAGFNGYGGQFTSWLKTVAMTESTESDKMLYGKDFMKEERIMCTYVRTLIVDWCIIGFLYYLSSADFRIFK